MQVVLLHVLMDSYNSLLTVIEMVISSFDVDSIPLPCKFLVVLHFISIPCLCLVDVRYKSFPSLLLVTIKHHFPCTVHSLSNLEMLQSRLYLDFYFYKKFPQSIVILHHLLLQLFHYLPEFYSTLFLIYQLFLFHLAHKPFLPILSDYLDHITLVFFLLWTVLR